MEAPEAGGPLDKLNAAREQMHRNKLHEHMFRTYINLRVGMAIIAATLPLVVYLVGRMDGAGLQASISAYYWASGSGDYRARVFMVGALFAVAAFLYLYKGFTKAENYALNLAAIFGAGVAIFPTDKPDCGLACGTGWSLHGFCAVSMFVCLVYVVWFCARSTLPYLPDDASRDSFRLRYKVTGAVMLVSPLAAVVMNWTLAGGRAFIFFVETAGILAFAYYWWVKSSELKLSGGMRKALQPAQAQVPLPPA